jgi:DNA-binding transcriptional LysR family regulator
VKGISGAIGFVRTVEAGSFAGAARKLGITPVAVSKNVQRLEQRLGVRLLRRSTRKLSLTEEGRLYYQRCVGPLRELESAESVIREQGKSPTGTIRVTSLSPSGARTSCLSFPRSAVAIRGSNWSFVSTMR